MVMRKASVLATLACAASLVACSSGSPTGDAGRDPAFAVGRVAVLAGEAGTAREDIRSLRETGHRLIQRARETADPAALVEAETAFDQLLELVPDDPDAVIGLGVIAAARHEFAEALELGRRADALAPGSSRALSIIVDAHIELGDYEAAGDALQRMLDARPDLSSYSRLSYFHELHGRTDLAIDAMERAVIAGGPAIENTEYVRVLLGDLWLGSGDVGRAGHLYERALEALPGYVPALRGLARVAATRGDLPTAITHLEAAAARVPLPDVLIELGETLQASGRADEAASQYELVRQIEGLYRSAGVVAEPGLALFEVDHGDPLEGLRIAQEAYGRAPSIRSADALAWALHGAGRTDEARAYADEALRTGTRDPGIRYHAGVIAMTQGDTLAAREHLTVSLAGSAMSTAWQAARIAEALAAAIRMAS